MEKQITTRYRPVDTITETEHTGMVKEIFATITRRYDLLNRLLSLRRDIAWRRCAARHMRFTRTCRYLDVATGTADLALEVARQHPRTTVTALDFVGEMIDAGVRKIEERNMQSRIAFVRSDALNLPFPNDHFDVAGIAFGIRNIPDKTAALKEMTRVVIPGGQVLVLEMHFPRQPLFRSFYSIYLTYLMPSLARSFSRNPAAYLYLADSIMHFPPPPEFSRIMRDSGLTKIQRYSLTLGITYLHVGIKGV
ncbi:MAG: ubiquinone/menaquinone biosynthesis methyltransferase [Deltaproteobacteria bacterium]|nr:ubiquinone/menaquinone biosynthesis methyltransferase [Deltaproteobacteria bacterium]